MYTLDRISSRGMCWSRNRFAHAMSWRVQLQGAVRDRKLGRSDTGNVLPPVAPSAGWQVRCMLQACCVRSEKRCLRMYIRTLHELLSNAFTCSLGTLSKLGNIQITTPPIRQLPPTPRLRVRPWLPMMIASKLSRKLLIEESRLRCSSSSSPRWTTTSLHKLPRRTR